MTILILKSTVNLKDLGREVFLHKIVHSLKDAFLLDIALNIDIHNVLVIRGSCVLIASSSRAGFYEWNFSKKYRLQRVNKFNEQCNNSIPVVRDVL